MSIREGSGRYQGLPKSKKIHQPLEVRFSVKKDFESKQRADIKPHQGDGGRCQSYSVGDDKLKVDHEGLWGWSEKEERG